jgi:hypothetical protein
MIAALVAAESQPENHDLLRQVARYVMTCMCVQYLLSGDPRVELAVRALLYSTRYSMEYEV